MGSNCKISFSGPPKGTSLRETTSFDVLIDKNGAMAAYGVTSWKNPLLKKDLPSEHLIGNFAYTGEGAKSPKRIVMQFCTGISGA